METSAPPPAKESPAGEPATEPAAATTEPAAAQKPKTRLLKEVEAEENAFIYKTLYQSLDDASDKAVTSELSDVSDILAASRQAKAEFFQATSQPLGAKAKGCGALMKQLGDAKNKKVASIFFTVTVMMFTLPVIALFIGSNVLAPWLGVDATLCGGLSGVAVAVMIMVGYTVYALLEDAEREREAAKKAAAEKSASSKKND